MSLVSPRIRSRPHFRHRVESNCAWENETADHEDAKMAVCEAINRLGLGCADVEVPVGRFVADVLWLYGDQRVAFEIQRANYTWAKFEEKLKGYAAEGVATVYLFIGDSFYRREEDGIVRLKDIEHRILSGRASSRYEPVFTNYEAGLMECYRVEPRPIGRVTGGYLRRSRHNESLLVVREPVFYPGITQDGWPKQRHVAETGSASTDLSQYLRSVYETFLEKPGMTLYQGRCFSRRLEAIWAHFFSAAGFDFQYSPSGVADVSKFEFFGHQNTVVAWLRSGPRPTVPPTSIPLALDDQPRYSDGVLILGDITYGDASDDAILACYGKRTPMPVVDFCQKEISYSGALSGLHDGGYPGGSYGELIAKRGLDLWLDGEARLTRGFPIPLCTPRFTGKHAYPRLVATR